MATDAYRIDTHHYILPAGPMADERERIVDSALALFRRFRN
jgi:hypothetical protein